MYEQVEINCPKIDYKKSDRSLKGVFYPFLTKQHQGSICLSVASYAASG